MSRPRTINVESFDLALTLRSGQFFRYAQERDAYLLLTQGRAITVSQHGTQLRFEGADERFVRHLLGLDDAYAAQLRRLRKDPVLRGMIARYAGLRLMRQDLHETILGFICSSQSNIPKIRMNLQLLSQHCGRRVGEHYHLPHPGALLPHDLVRGAKTGYRAKFLVETNRQLSAQRLAALQSTDYETSHAMLCELPGIGPKIADCVCLFALGHGEAFPVDVHILRAMRILFPDARLLDERAAKRFAQARWGPDAGLAQQFIYQWARDTLSSRDAAAGKKPGRAPRAALSRHGRVMA